jgi:hypothetical protein
MSLHTETLSIAEIVQSLVQGVPFHLGCPKNNTTKYQQVRLNTVGKKQ